MRVEDDVVDARLDVHEAVPVALEVQEGVANDHGRVSVAVADRAPPVVVEALDVGHVERGAVGFVEQSDAGDDVGGGGVALGEAADGEEGLRRCVALLPADGAAAPAVVEAVLRAGGWRGVS